MITTKKEVKCIIWDLDNTIWDGILVESDNVKLKPKIIEIIQTLDSRGILQSIASKNNYDDAMRKLEEFELNQYFIYPEIHWNAKSSSVECIQKNINIGIDTILFIDDQAFERDEVKNVHNEVVCVDASKYLDLINEPCLNPRFITSDSSKRRLMYMADIERNKLEEDFEGPKESFLASLNMEFEISDAQEEDLKRAEELTVRTNQLNATGITYDYDELNSFRNSDKHKLYICELKDKYGAYGKIGLALVELSDEYWHIKLLLMSCRVISRGVGTVLMSFIMQEAKKRGKKLLADFKKTNRNRMMLVSYKFSNFKEITSDDNGNILFENDLSIIQDFPSYIKIKINCK
jgi:FkbH-like protein